MSRSGKKGKRRGWQLSRKRSGPARRGAADHCQNPDDHRVTVSDAESFLKAIQSKEPLIVQVSGTIRLEEPERIASNKTLLGLGADATIGRPLLRRLPTEQAAAYVERLVAAYLAEREPGEGLQSFAKRKSDEELISIGTGQPLAVATA